MKEGDDMLDKNQLRQFSTWSGLIGIFTIISGILSCISIVGIIPGIISIILGIKLRNAKNRADEIMAEISTTDEIGKLNLLISDLTTYFKIQGILIIVSLVMVVLGVLGFMGIGALFYNAVGSFY